MKEPQVYYYILDGEPTPLKRGVMKLPKSQWHQQKTIKSNYRLAFEKQHLRHLPFSGPLEIEYSFYFGDSKQRHNHHSQKPDLLDLVALVQEAAHKILFDNSCIIVRSVVTKHYGGPGRTEIIIKELP